MNEELKIVLKAITAEAQKQLSNVKKELRGVRDESQDAAKASNSLLETIDKQTHQLALLKGKYVDMVAKYGKFSDEAELAAAEVADLSLSLKQNREAAEAAIDAINQYDNTIQQTQEVTVGFTEKVHNQLKELHNLKIEYIDLVAEYGETSAQALNCADSIAILSAELVDNKVKLAEAMRAADRYDNTIEDADAEAKGFINSLEEQAKELTILKKKYIEIAKAYGEESEAAIEAAKAIQSLSNEYKENLELSERLAQKANSFDSSRTTKSINGTTTSVDELYESIDKLRTLSFYDLLLEMFNVDGVKTKLGELTDSVDLFKTNMNYAFSGLFKNGKYYKETGEEWQGLGKALKGFGTSAKDAFKALGSAVKDMAATISAALSSLVGILAVIVADILIVIGLTKNALNVAKQLKQEMSEASKLGLDTRSYQEWGYVLQQVGVSTDKLSDFLKTLADEQNAVRDGSEEMVAAFEAIGLSQEEVMGMDQQQLFEETVKGLQNMENAAERTSTAYRIFGEDAAELANVLYLTNQETQSLINNYYNLGAAPSDNLINKSKILSASTQNLSYAWQGLKNTLAEWVIPAVIKVVQWITTVVAYINVFLQGIFGIESAGKGASEGVESIGDGVQEVGKSADKTTKSLKEMLRYTMGFDELNIIPSQNTDNGGGGGDDLANSFATTGINPELPVIEIPDMTKFREFMAEYGSLIQGILTWTLIGIGVLLAVFGFMSGNIALGLLGISIAGLGIAVGAAGGENSHWNKLGEGIKNVLQSIGDFFANIWDRIKEIWNTVGDWFSNLFTNAWEGIKNAWNAVGDWFSNLWDGIKKVWNAVTTWFSDIFKKAWTGIKDAWKSVKTWFSDLWKGIKDVFSSVGSWFSDIFKKAWTGIKNAFSSVGSFFRGIWQDIKDIFSKAGTAIGEGVSKAFSGAINWVLEKAVSIINGFLKAINNAIGLINKVPGVNIKKIELLDVPKLATGGIVSSATMAMIGERGKEAVLPLENNTGWMDMLADRIAARNNSPSKIVLQVGEKELGWATIKSINGITKQTGGLQLHLV